MCFCISARALVVSIHTLGVVVVYYYYLTNVAVVEVVALPFA